MYLDEMPQMGPQQGPMQQQSNVASAIRNYSPDYAAEQPRSTVVPQNMGMGGAATAGAGIPGPSPVGQAASVSATDWRERARNMTPAYSGANATPLPGEPGRGPYNSRQQLPSPFKPVTYE